MCNETAPSSTPLPETLLLQALPARLWVILGGLRAAVAAWGGRDRAAVPMVVLVHGRIGRLAQRFAALVAHLVAGTLPPPRLRAPRDRGKRAAYARLPRGAAWLVRMLQETVAYGSQLQALLEEPAMAALLAACPRAGRILRPLHRMLGMAEPGAKVRDPKPFVARARPAVGWAEAAASWAAGPGDALPVGYAPAPRGRSPPGWP